MDKNLLEIVKRIKIVISDLDGVFTDGCIYKGNDGAEFKKFSVLDGAGVALAQSVGLKLAIISGRYSPATVSRAEELGLSDDCYQDGYNKIDVFEKLKTKYDFSNEEAVFIGDDIIDLPLLNQVGLPIAVANAIPRVKAIAKFVTETKGGEGAFREVIEMILHNQGKYETALKNLAKRAQVPNNSSG